MQPLLTIIAMVPIYAMEMETAQALQVDFLAYVMLDGLAILAI